MSRKMSTLRIVVLGALTCAALGVAAIDRAAAEEASEIRLTRVTGQAAVRHYGAREWTDAEEGATIARDDVIETGDKASLVASWSNGSLVLVRPNSRISIDGIVYDLDKKLESSFVSLEKGGIFVKAQTPESLFTEFQVRAGGLAYRSQGAEFGLALDEDGGTSLFSLLGRVVTDVDNQRFRIDEGRQLVVKGPQEGKAAAESRMTGETDLTLEQASGRVVTDVDNQRFRMDEGRQLVVKGPLEGKAAESRMTGGTKESLEQTSKELGGSLLVEEDIMAKAGGPLNARIGRILGRRGNAPFKVTFRALVSGGSGRLRKIEWDFGDGTMASTPVAEHTFTYGQYVVILRAEDQDGDKATAQMDVSVEADCSC